MSIEDALRHIAAAQHRLDLAVHALTSDPPLSLPGRTGSEDLPPPAGGPYGYASFVPPIATGARYVDPVFGTTVARLTLDHGKDDIYGRNMVWSADETRYLHRTGGLQGVPDAWDVIDVGLGAASHQGVPFGYYAADGGFDPVEANVLYTLQRDRGDGHGEIHRTTLQPGGAWETTLDYVARGELFGLGGSVNWLDRSARYMLIREGPEPSVRVYNRSALSAGPYANPIDARPYVEAGGYLGLSPDGLYVVGFDGRQGTGVSGVGQAVSWAIDHAQRRVAATPTVFWSLCGDHGGFVSASDGHTYFVTYDCYAQAGLWRADVSNNALGLSANEQHNLSGNVRLLALPTWQDFGHVSGVARGPFRDWAMVATEDASDVDGSGVDGTGNVNPWHPYRQEVLAVHVLTGEIRRLVHHRSRMAGDYQAQPRVSVSWGGAWVGWASNYNVPGVVDVYALRFAP